MANHEELDGSRTTLLSGDGRQPRWPERQAPILVIVPIKTARHAVVALTGDLDLSTAEEVQAAAERCLSARPQRLSMDLSGLEFCDCTGVRVLRGVLKDAQAAGADFRLLAPSDWILRVFSLANAADLLAASTDPQPGTAALDERGA
jgi:anti-sigma B factor antagonist